MVRHDVSFTGQIMSAHVILTHDDLSILQPLWQLQNFLKKVLKNGIQIEFAAYNGIVSK